MLYCNTNVSEIRLLVSVKVMLVVVGIIKHRNEQRRDKKITDALFAFYNNYWTICKKLKRTI